MTLCKISVANVSGNGPMVETARGLTESRMSGCPQSSHDQDCPSDGQTRLAVRDILPEEWDEVKTI